MSIPVTSDFLFLMPERSKHLAAALLFLCAADCTTAKFKKYNFWSRTELIIGLHDVVFHGEDARNVQNCVTLQNNLKNLKKLSENLEKSGRKIFRESKNEMWGIV